MANKLLYSALNLTRLNIEKRGPILMSLNLIKKEELKRKVIKNFSYSFAVERAGIHVIIIAARAKSWFQNTTKFISFFRDDNLAVRINGLKFPKLSGERGEFDSEASWNGNKLKGLRQVNLFVVYFEPGEQSLEFISKGSPFLESVDIYQVSKNQISIDPSKYGIENGDRRPWFNILTQNVGVISVTAKAIASFENGDDNDLQIRINGIREQNNTPKAHKYWFWCGRVLRGQSKTFERTLSLKPGIHYVEFWADGVPIFNELTVHVTMSDRIPSINNPEWTGDFYNDSKEIILARLIFGEARSQSQEAKIWVAGSVLNRVKALAWPNTVHEVILQKDQYKSFNLDDPNLRFITNPLLDSSQKESWEECFGIASEILNGTIQNPTEATHFHDARQSQESYVKLVVPNGKFLKRIDDLFFYWSPN